MDTREDRVFAQFQKVCQKVWLSSKSMPVYITLKKCSTQYVAHFMWLTKSLKIGEYATICSTEYFLPGKISWLPLFCTHQHFCWKIIPAYDFIPLWHNGKNIWLFTSPFLPCEWAFKLLLKSELNSFPVVHTVKL